MEFGKSLNEVTDRDMHDDWAKFRELKKQFDDNFEAWVCASPEKLQEILDEMDKLSKKVSLPQKMSTNEHRHIKLFSNR